MSDSFNGNIGSERESVLVFVSLAEEFFKNGSFEEAINYCKMALQQIADLKEAKLLLYRCYLKLNLKKDADNMKIELISENPDDKEVQALFNDIKENVDNDIKGNADKEEQPKKENELPAPDIIDIPKHELVEAVEEAEENVKSEDETSAPDTINIQKHELEEAVDEAHEEISNETQKIDDNEMLSADQTENLLDNALSEINKIKGVLGSIIIEESGIIIKEKTVEGLDAEVASALFSTIFYVSEDSIEKLNLGQIDRVFIEIGKVRVYLFKGNGYIIGIFTEEIVKIGLIHVKAKQLLQNIKKVLEV